VYLGGQKSLIADWMIREKCNESFLNWIRLNLDRDAESTFVLNVLQVLQKNRRNLPRDC
jgi:hypothetical protein